MNTDKILGQLSSIRLTLDKIAVSGEQNMNRLLGCIQLIDQMIEDNKPKENEDPTI